MTIVTLPARASVLATDIRQARGEVVSEPRAVLDATNTFVLGSTTGSRVQSVLQRMVRRREINERQAEAGERFAIDVEKTGASIPSILAGKPRGGGLGRDTAMAQEGLRMMLAMRRVKAAMEALSLRPVQDCVLWVACYGIAASRWACSCGREEREGLVLLELGLDTLIEHYDRVVE